MTNRLEQATRSLHRALAEGCDEDLILKLDKLMIKFKRQNMLHQAPNVAVVGTLLWMVAKYTTEIFPDPEAGKSAVATFAGYLEEQMEIMYAIGDEEHDHLH